MELAFQDSHRFAGEISFIAPTLDPGTRTLTVRMELDNPELTLKPGMFATVRIESPGRSDALLLPSEAIIHSGQRQLVFVALDLGRYEAREITTGMVGDNDRVELLAGVREGERVVTSGQFLLDSESQLQEAVQKMLAARLQAREKRALSTAEQPASGGGTAESVDGYWTCGMHPQVVQDQPGSCPICGMNLTLKGGDHD
jgi:Cu(I)/Ag(I) efflux system membrane fusion protein/cobalt-zinc-cadmium efflux system membrane fusion protein